jgi:hypothetical protein
MVKKKSPNVTSKENREIHKVIPTVQLQIQTKGKWKVYSTVCSRTVPVPTKLINFKVIQIIR